MFTLSAVPIVAVEIECRGAGGFVSFEGKVRDHAEGRAVVGLEYEAHNALAVAAGDELIAEATSLFDLKDVRITHRTGSLAVGETAVLIQVAAPHRREAFAACEWLIDQLKHRVPIWKREIFADGTSSWVGAEALPFDDSEMFTRQVRMPEVGAEGQAKLQNARVLVVGIGGLAAGAIPALVGAGVGTIGLVDDDTVDRSNLHRQALFGWADAGRLKVDRAAAYARRLRPGVAVEAYPERVDEDNVDRLVASYDWIIDGTDSLSTKFLLNAAAKRHRKPLITASVHRFDGHLMLITPDGPCLRCLFPEAPPDGCVGTCAETGVLGVVPHTLGLLQANEVIKGILGLGEGLAEHLVAIDLRSYATTRLQRLVLEGCLGCAGVYEGDPVEISSFQAALARFPSVELWDIREDRAEALPLPHRVVAASEVAKALNGKPIVLCCHRGITSLAVAREMRGQGFESVFSLRGGAEGLKRGR